MPQIREAVAFDIVEMLSGDGAPKPHQLAGDRGYLFRIRYLPGDLPKQDEQPGEQRGIVGAVPARPKRIPGPASVRPHGRVGGRT